ncbi:MAG TPA: hypothetical protein VIW24_02420 [Aldersonia sp.]
MFTAAALVASPPILVPELGGAQIGATEPLRMATLDVVATLRGHGRIWTVLGVDAQDCTLGPDVRGTFRGYGVDVEVALGPNASGPADPGLPLAALIAGWLREAAAPDTDLRIRILAEDTTPDACARIGRDLRADLDATEEPRVLLVVADGANTLTAKAPGAFDERAPQFQADLDRALAIGDRAALAALDPALCKELGVAGRAAYQVLAAVFGDTAATCTTAYDDAPFGVSYHVGLWRPA